VASDVGRLDVGDESADGVECSSSAVCKASGVNHSFGIAFSMKGIHELTYASRFTQLGNSFPQRICAQRTELGMLIPVFWANLYSYNYYTLRNRMNQSFQEFLLIVMQLSIGKIMKTNKFKNRFPKPKTRFPVFD